ncbi:hypothetical protein E1211_05170 [Micromonospora sp. 15K316]|uniref:hypothetical protein n=1 Tax=Micromonospora sp. 15K316 TaxID=2530376 RepID=UPI0010469885|nr:hypothetical protein [Micromonospora sp. 15K316]TDC39060.1 hypothetical protein E1211_05170 [Micromonospora sp. 15K316]
MTPHNLLAAAPCLILPALTLGYLGLCVIAPFGRCRSCDGNGRKRSPLGRIRRECRNCAGTGLRLRVGRHVINHIKDEYETAKR